jgi:hypothetical protein
MLNKTPGGTLDECAHRAFVIRAQNSFAQRKSPSCTIQEGQTLGRDDKAFEKWDNKEGGINPLAGKSTRV